MQPRRRHGSDFWLEHFRRWKSSGLSQTQYSLSQKISAKTFSRWCGRLKRDGVIGEEGPTAKSAARAFVPLVVGEAHSVPNGAGFHAALRFRIEGTPLIAEVAAGTDSACLEGVLRVLLRSCK